MHYIGMFPVSLRFTLDTDGYIMRTWIIHEVATLQKSEPLNYVNIVDAFIFEKDDDYSFEKGEIVDFIQIPFNLIMPSARKYNDIYMARAKVSARHYLHGDRMQIYISKLPF